MNKLKFKKGFTLIELLVVVSIIAMLASIILSSLSDAKNKAGDAAKVRELQEVRTALQMYFSDFGYYPGSTWKTDLTTGSKKYIGTISSNLFYSGFDGLSSACNTTPCNSYHMGIVLSNTNKVLDNDKDINIGFEGNGANCSILNANNDRCYDITP